MSRARLLLHGRVPAPGGGGLNSLAVLQPPELSGPARENSTYWINGGVWDTLPNKYRIRLYRDGLLFLDATQAESAVTGDWTSAEVGKAITGTVEASATGGAPWSAPADIEISYTFPSDLITPATIPTPTLTRLSSSGTVPMQFSISSIDLYDSYYLHIVHKNAAATLLEDSYVALTETDLTTPFTIDLGSTADPAPNPPLSTGAATDVYEFSIVSGDYQPGLFGVTSASVTLSPTDTSGSRYWTINMTAGVQTTLTAIEASTTHGGADVLVGKTFTVIPSGALSASGSFATSHYIDGDVGLTGTIGSVNVNTFGFPVKIVFDLGLPMPLTELRLKTRPDFNSGPSAYTFGGSDSGGTYSGTPPVSASGVTYSNTVVDTKTSSW